MSYTIIEHIHDYLNDISSNYYNIKITNCVNSRINRIYSEFDPDIDHIIKKDCMDFSFEKIKEFIEGYFDNEDISVEDKYRLIDDIIKELIDYYNKNAHKIFIIDIYNYIMIILFQNKIYDKYIKEFSKKLNQYDMSDSDIYNKFSLIIKILFDIEELQTIMFVICKFYNIEDDILRESVYDYIDKKYRDDYIKCVSLNYIYKISHLETKDEND